MRPPPPASPGGGLLLMLLYGDFSTKLKVCDYLTALLMSLVPSLGELLERLLRRRGLISLLIRMAASKDARNQRQQKNK